MAETVRGGCGGFHCLLATKGVAYVICTDISKDGMLQGPSLELYREIFPEAMYD